jgi:hypothetical protein
MRLIVQCAGHGLSPNAIEWSFEKLDAPPLEWAITRCRIFLQSRRRTNTYTRCSVGVRSQIFSRYGLSGDEGERFLSEIKGLCQLAGDCVETEVLCLADTLYPTPRGLSTCCEALSTSRPTRLPSLS